MTVKPPGNHGGAVGYGRPPKEHQFKPGQSGNPKGRPKRQSATTLHGAIAEGLQETVTVRINGRPQKLTQANLLSKQLIAKASNGDIKALHILMQMVKGAPEPSPLPGLLGAADRLKQKFEVIRERQRRRAKNGEGAGEE